MSQKADIFVRYHVRSCGVGNVAVEGFMENGDAFLLGHAQANLNERSSVHPFLVVPQFAQGALLAIQVGVGHIVDHPGIAQAIALLDGLKDRSL